MLNRRSLLLGALAAPAIVRAESLMRIWVPPRRVWAGEWGASFLKFSGEPERQARLNAVMREHLVAVDCTWVRDPAAPIFEAVDSVALDAQHRAAMRGYWATILGDAEKVARLEPTMPRPRWVRA